MQILILFADLTFKILQEKYYKITNKTQHHRRHCFKLSKNKIKRVASRSLLYKDTMQDFV